MHVDLREKGSGAEPPRSALNYGAGIVALRRAPRSDLV